MSEAVQAYRSQAVATQASGLLQRYRQTRDLDDLHAAIRLLRESVTAAPRTRIYYAQRLNDLGNALAILAEDTGDPEISAEAVTVHRAAVDAFPGRHPDRGDPLNNLGNSLTTCFRITGNADALAQSIEAHRACVDATPAGHRHHASHLTNLAITLFHAFEHTDDVAALTESVTVFLTASRIRGPGTPTRLHHLGTALLTLARRTGDADALAEAIRAYRAAADALPDDSPWRGAYLSDLSDALHERFERTGDVDVLDDAIALLRAAVDAAQGDPAEHAGYQHNLGIVLVERYRHTGDSGALAEGLAAHRAAVGVDRVRFQGSLATALQEVYLRTGDVDALAEAVAGLRAAADAAGEGAPDHARHLSNLGHGLEQMFARTGDMTCLTEAIARHRAAVAATPDDHPDLARRLSHLGSCLRELSVQTDSLDTLEEAVARHRDAVRAAPPDHPLTASYLANLATALEDLHERTADTAALDEAIETHRSALAATPADHPGRAQRLSNLGRALMRRGRVIDPASLTEWAGTHFRALARDGVRPGPTDVPPPWVERAGDATAVDEAVAALRAAVDLTSGDDPFRSSGLGLLAAALGRRSEVTGNLDDMAEAITVQRAALAATADDDPGHVEHQVNLGISLRHMSRDSGNLHLLDESRTILAEVARSESAPVRMRIHAGMELARAGTATGDHRSALAALEEAIGLLPMLAPRALARTDREFLLGDVLGLGAQAAAAALSAGWPGRAVELLEQARGLLLAEEFDRQGQRTRTSTAAPDLADLRIKPSIDSLRRQAAAGPIVIVTADYDRCDALIVTDDPAEPVRAVRLPAISYWSVFQYAMLFVMACGTVAEGEVGLDAFGDARAVIEHTLGWLWDTVTAPVLTELEQTAGRIWWCPVGMMAYLPLHAAGHHGPRSSGRNSVLDLVVSSYIPTIRALAHARERARERTGERVQERAGAVPDGTGLIVALPGAPGSSVLPGITAEVEALSALLPDVKVLAGQDAIREKVLAALPGHPVTHFACHAVSDWERPGHSELILHDHATTPTTAAQISGVRLTGAALAYLSACETSSTGARLADEAVHITSAFLLAGYPQVIGTMWPVADAASARIAAGFYHRLTAGGTRPPEPAGAARALHDAILDMRDRRPGAPFLWAAHIHVGA